jgi:hypothetical protein
MSHQPIPASRAEATSALRALFEAFPVDRKEGAGGAATYLIAVEGYSAEAITKAVKRLIRGEVAGVDARFLPTPAQVSAAVRYCEDLIAPVAPRQALPAPGDEVRTPAEQALVDAVVAAARARLGIERPTGGEIITDREAIPRERLAQLDRNVEAVAARIKTEGLPRLSLEAINALTPLLTDEEVEELRNPKRNRAA